ncbi:MAG: hypothetical protein DLM63_09890 [Solirubrobacterales bacterium]|nr:MAG: hypothetical protein DLM63_09890 [Solirubrobacterales bacterium]
MTPKAILLNPGNHELFGWDELWGIPVLPDERVAAKRFRIDCDGSAFGIEEEVAEEITRREPIEVPVAPGLPAAPLTPGWPGIPQRDDHDSHGREPRHDP